MKGRTYDDTLIVMAPTDTVATALRDLDPGETVQLESRTVEVTEPVPFGHKLAIQPHRSDDTVRKYGEVIGQTTESVPAGSWVHTHNLESNRGRPDRAGSSPAGQQGDSR